MRRYPLPRMAWFSPKGFSSLVYSVLILETKLRRTDGKIRASQA